MRSVNGTVPYGRCPWTLYGRVSVETTSRIEISIDRTSHRRTLRGYTPQVWRWSVGRPRVGNAQWKIPVMLSVIPEV